MTNTTLTRRRAHRSGRRLGAKAIVLAAVIAIAGAGCAAPSAPAGPGGLDINFGPITIPLPPFEIRPPATVIPFGPCGIGYQPPGFIVRNATVTIPGIRIDPNQPIITVPNVLVNIPYLGVPLATVDLACSVGPIPLPPLTVTPSVIIPSQVLIKAATLNLAAKTITLGDPYYTPTGAGLDVNGLGLIIPLPFTVSVPLPSTAISYA